MHSLTLPPSLPPPPYQVGCTKEGILKAAQVELYTNSGCTLDLSTAVLHRAMWHVDNAYFIPHWRVVGRNCRTNVPSNTAFRGFGGPQGMLVAETFISKVAEVRAEEGKWERGRRWRVGRRPCSLQFDQVHSLCLNFSNFFSCQPSACCSWSSALPLQGVWVGSHCCPSAEPLPGRRPHPLRTAGGGLPHPPVLGGAGPEG